MLNDKKILLDFYRTIEKFNSFEYFIALLKAQLAPTSSNLKLGTMLNFKNGKRPLKIYWQNYKYYLKDIFDLSFFELRKSNDNILVYFYNKKRLAKKLREEKINKFLKELGYENCQNTYEYLITLRTNFKDRCPDEIGVFLGYPLKDVIDFKNKDKGECKCIGYWKCFNNAESAQNAFKRYDNVKKIEIEKIVANA
ncbi:DUF3793 family protein [Peptoniphilus raoultii]|uniref:DUF3793 family protein n=1 Tax=Peptoniphilus raoultii TaxID=1776387 RepID=UPI0008D957DA|nr:DUF3793 family protein [Peptoniphilus raoultii]